MKTFPIWASLLAASYLTTSPGAFGQAPGDLSIDVSQCVELESEVERLACYDRLATSARTDRAEDGDGKKSVRAPTVPQRLAERAPEGPAEITSTITALEEYLPNAYQVTLANGQIWRQIESKRYPLRVGYTVRVYPSRWADSYRLSAEELNGFIRIEPVQ